jgi:mono/diheme cytochrome c family protein
MSPDGSQNREGSPSASFHSPGKAGAAAVEREPSAGSAPVPGWLIGAVALLIYVGDIYVTNHGGFRGQGFDARVYAPFSSLEDVQDHQPKVNEPEGWALGKTKFAIYCAACHGVEGQGNAGNGTPPLALSQWVNSEHADRMTRIVLNAVIGPIDVAGATFNNPGMLAWGESIKDDAEIAAILTFVRGSFGNKASPVAAAEVAAIRKATASHGKWTAPELNDIKP